MRFDEGTKLLPVVDLGLGGRHCWPRLRFDIPRCRLPLTPQVDGVATDVEQLGGLAFLETIQFNRLHDFLTEVIAVRFGHSNRNKYFSSLSPNQVEYGYINDSVFEVDVPCPAHASS